MTQHKVEMYCSYFAAELTGIAATSNTMHRKLLTVAVLDTFGRALDPKANNYDRFVGVVRAMCDWKDAERVSLPQLAMTLAATPAASSKKLAHETEGRIRGWDRTQVIRIHSDPEMNELINIAPGDQKLLKEHQHVNLLYAYRNSLVHEFREPGYDFGNLGDDPTPYYMSMDDEQGNHLWELGYPVAFFARLADRALTNLKGYFIAQGRDPYDSYEFGSRWRRR